MPMYHLLHVDRMSLFWFLQLQLNGSSSNGSRVGSIAVLKILNRPTVSPADDQED